MIKFGIIIRIFCFPRLLSDIFILDYKMFTSSSTRGDTRREFLESVLPPLEKLKDIVIEEAQTQSNNGSNGGKWNLGDNYENIISLKEWNVC